jgi:hypothetical protein
LELPPQVARAFVKAMERYFARTAPMKQDEIVVLQLHALRGHTRGKLRSADVKELFERMRDHLA